METTQELYMKTLVDMANDRASTNHCTGYAFQFGYVVTDIEDMLNSLNLNKRQLKALETRRKSLLKHAGV